MSKKHATVRDSTTGRFTVGAKGMAKLNAVESIKLSASSRRMFAEFESRNMSAEERRRAIIAKHAKKA